ncbi:MAG: MgtC/SapB family protein, partial [Sandaracinaceae bacterium]|nr:MgtC/SapB family protein [Sandaracinaceae bacterium]
MTEQGVSVLISLAAALTAGFVIGAEREQERKAQFGGIRTFPMIALAGALGALVGVWLLVSLALGFFALLAISYYRETEPGPEQDHGLSTEIAALTTFGIGAFCAAHEIGLPLTDRLLLVGGATTAVLGLLSFKKTLHGVAERISKQEVYAATKLLMLSVVLLPLLPDRDLGPWGALNPRSIGLLVVLISAIGFAGYVAVRAFGTQRGLGLTGLLGGLASSTAVTLTFSGRARESPALVGGCAVAIILASSTMFPRVAVLVAAVSPALGPLAMWPFGVTGAMGLLVGFVLYRRMAGERRTETAQPEEPMRLANPFSLSSALKFAAL